MISDEMLKKATAEADQAIRDSLPAPAECEHEFSPSFQRKMRRTFRKAKYDVIHIRVVPFCGEMSYQFLMTSGSLSYCPVASRPHS